MTSTLLPADLTTPCVQWPGTKSPENYGRLGDNLYAHRVAWEEATGEPIPDGLHIDHLCHNAAYARGECEGGVTCLHRLCVNTDHLDATSQAENLRRGASPWAVNRRKTHCVRGHEFTEANTLWRRGVRECIECRTEWNRQTQSRRFAERTHCPKGHEYTPENTKWIRGHGDGLIRRCIACVTERPDCPHGHPWTEENTAYLASGSRRCKTCHREEARARHRRNREQRNV